MSVRLMIADDHLAIRAGVISLIQGTEIELVCQAETCDQTVKFALTCKPDVVLLDLRLEGSDGLNALEQIKRENPNIAVLIFSSADEVKEMAHARKFGADGFVPKGATREELLSSIRRVATGKRPHGRRGRFAKLSVVRRPRRSWLMIAVRLVTAKRKFSRRS